MTDPSPSSTVLVVEDKEELAETFAAWLEPDHEVRLALTGHEALDLADETVDVVLLDRRLPDIDGREVLDRLRADGLDCRVCMVTAVQPDFDILDMGFDDYAVKPVFQDDLLVDRLQRLRPTVRRPNVVFGLEVCGVDVRDRGLVVDDEDCCFGQTCSLIHTE